MFVYAKDRPVEDLGGGVTRKILAHDGGLMQVEVSFREGAVGPLHSHPHEQLTYVLSGEFEFTIATKRRSSVPATRCTRSRVSCTDAAASSRRAARHVSPAADGSPRKVTAQRAAPAGKAPAVPGTAGRSRPPAPANGAASERDDAARRAQHRGQRASRS